MVTYNPKDWFTLIIQFHKSDTFRRLFWSLVSIGIYAAIIVFSEAHFFHLETKNPTVMHSILGFVLSMLLVFRTNSAYDRWWEGRKVWGSTVNNSRNLALKLSVILVHEKDKQEIKHLITNYVFAFKNHLRGKYIQEEFTPTDNINLSQFADANHKPNFIAKSLYAKINSLYLNKDITGDQLIVLNEELKSFTDNVGACERIKNTPIPYSYSSFIKKFIFFFVMTLPFGFVFSLGYYVIPVVIFIFYVLASLELIAEEIEDPFGNDANDLPMTKIASNIKKHVEEIL